MRDIAIPQAGSRIPTMTDIERWTVVRDNFRELATTRAGLSNPTYNCDIMTNESEVVISGSNFLPQITTEPVLPIAMQYVNGVGTLLDIVNRYQKNGDFYDIVINPQIDDYLGVKIIIIY